jgi:hypothetical protein
MKLCLYLALICIELVPGSLFADSRKDESGHRRGGPPQWGQRGGEPPDWARGRGVWDGHFKHGGRPEFRQNWVQPSTCTDQRFFPHYAPVVPYGWNQGGAWNDHKDRWKDAREREREAYLKWQEQSREREQEIREQERESLQKWQEWQRERNRGSRQLSLAGGTTSGADSLHRWDRFASACTISPCVTQWLSPTVCDVPGRSSRTTPIL